MQVEQRSWSDPAAPGTLPTEAADLVLAFGARNLVARADMFDAVRSAYPGAHVVGCSTSGEIRGDRVFDDTLQTTSIRFAQTRIRVSSIEVARAASSHEAGTRLAEDLLGRDLVHVLIISDGLHVNGSELVRGLRSRLPGEVKITGGLAGDAMRFEHTPIWADTHMTTPSIAAVGFYGKHLDVGSGSRGGWDPFGPDRLITRSAGNVLYALDDHSALDLYKKYLGSHAVNLPASGLLFPLAIRTQTNDSAELVRSVIGVDEHEKSITFAGDVPQGTYARFMKTNNERIIDGAMIAARAASEAHGPEKPAFALLVSCVGRKQVLGQRTEEEVEAVREVIGPDVPLGGFYSYGEIAPDIRFRSCELHNQTMTVTTFAERTS